MVNNKDSLNDLIVTSVCIIDKISQDDEETGISYTEKEYNYAKTKGLPVLVLIKQPSGPWILEN